MLRVSILFSLNIMYCALYHYYYIIIYIYNLQFTMGQVNPKRRILSLSSDVRVHLGDGFQPSDSSLSFDFHSFVQLGSHPDSDLLTII